MTVGIARLSYLPNLGGRSKRLGNIGLNADGFLFKKERKKEICVILL
jgi:hypothetical protein